MLITKTNDPLDTQKCTGESSSQNSHNCLSSVDLDGDLYTSRLNIITRNYNYVKIDLSCSLFL